MMTELMNKALVMMNKIRQRNPKYHSLWVSEYDVAQVYLTRYGSFTAVTIVGTRNITWYEPPIGVGVSKCSPKDDYNSEIGDALALNRACRDFMDSLQDKETQS